MWAPIVPRLAVYTADLYSHWIYNVVVASVIDEVQGAGTEL